MLERQSKCVVGLNSLSLSVCVCVCNKLCYTEAFDECDVSTSFVFINVFILNETLSFLKQ